MREEYKLARRAEIEEQKAEAYQAWKAFKYFKFLSDYSHCCCDLFLLSEDLNFDLAVEAFNGLWETINQIQEMESVPKPIKTLQNNALTKLILIHLVLGNYEDAHNLLSQVSRTSLSDFCFIQAENLRAQIRSALTQQLNSIQFFNNSALPELEKDKIKEKCLHIIPYLNGAVHFSPNNSRYRYYRARISCEYSIRDHEDSIREDLLVAIKNDDGYRKNAEDCALEFGIDIDSSNSLASSFLI